MIVIGLSRQQALDTDPKTIQQSFFTGNLELIGNTQMFFILKEVKENIMGFSQGAVKVF